jgi:hypothetical protein
MENYPEDGEGDAKAVWELFMASAVEPVNMQERWESAIQALEDANKDDEPDDE